LVGCKRIVTFAGITGGDRDCPVQGGIR